MNADRLEMIERLAATAMECRKAIREAHEATRDLRLAIREAHQVEAEMARIRDGAMANVSEQLVTQVGGAADELLSRIQERLVYLIESRLEHDRPALLNAVRQETEAVLKCAGFMKFTLDRSEEDR